MSTCYDIEKDGESIAAAIGKIGSAMVALRMSGLTDKAIIVLVADHSKLSKSVVKKVLNSLNELGNAYLRKS